MASMACECAIVLDQPLRLEVKHALVSPNQWQGRHWRVKHKLSQDWETAIGGAVADLMLARHGGKLDFPHVLMAMSGPRGALGGRYAPGKRRVIVERYVPSARNFIRDDDNLRFSVKPLLDALKRQGYITNDSRKWLEHPTPTQHVSTDKTYRTVILIEPVN